MSELMEIAQVRLIVDDFPLVFRYYRDVLGLTPQVDDERGPYGKLSLPRGQAAIALQARAHLKETVPGLGVGAPDRFVVALRVDDLDQTLRELEARGAKPLSPPSTQWGRLRLAHLRDPEQNLIELQQWLVAP